MALTKDEAGVLKFILTFVLFKVILFVSINRASKWAKTL